jgi:O-antigen/teichoic acid export membrane protein
MTPLYRVVMNTGILYARMAVTMFLSLYTTRIVLVALGAEDFGIFNLVGGTIAMLTFLNASMAAATQRFMSFSKGQGNENRQHQIFNVSIVLHSGIALLILALIEAVGFWLFNGTLKIEPERMQAAWLVYQFAAASTCFTILAVPYDAVINAHEHMLMFAVLGVIEAVLKLAIGLVIANAVIDKLELYGLLMAALSVILLLIRVGYCHRKYRECKLNLRRHFSRTLFNEMTAFAGWSLLGTSISMLTNYGQGLLLNMFFGATVNAAQGIANQISGQLSVLANSLMQALNPVIAKSEGVGDRDLMLKASMVGSKAGFLLLVLVYVPVIVEMPYLFSIWLNKVPEYAIIFCRILLLRKLVEQFYLPIISSIAATGRIKNLQITTSILMLLAFSISGLLFYLDCAPYIIYISFLIGSVITFGIALFNASQQCDYPVRIYIKEVVIRCLGVLVLVISVSVPPLFFISNGLMRICVVTMISVVSFIVATWWIGFGVGERIQLKTIIFDAKKNRKYQL